MARKLISSRSLFEREIGYSRAVIDGEWILVSVAAGFDYTSMTIDEDIVGQCERALKNIESALAEAHSTMADVMRTDEYNGKVVAG